MMTFATEEKRYTVEEYLEREVQSQHKHEYFNGRIVLMAGASFEHNVITGNIITALNNAIEAKRQNFIVCPSDMKIHIPTFQSFVYPDAVIVFEKPSFYKNRNDVILNPTLVVEVASPSTAEYDRTTKFWRYQTLPSFKEMVIVEQDFPFVKSFYKSAEHTWQDAEATQLNESIFLPSIDCNIELRKIYRNVAFPPSI